MHDKRAHICGLRCKCKLSAELGQRFVEAEQAGRDQDNADREEQYAWLNTFGDQGAEGGSQQSTD